MSELPKGWIAARLSDIAELKYGKSLPAKIRADGQVPVYGSNGRVGNHTEAITSKPAIIVGRKGSIGEVHFSDVACFPIDTTYYIDEFHDVPPRFLELLLKSLGLTERDRASAIPGLNRDDAYSIEIAVPPANEQRRIVAKLDSLRTRSARARDELGHIPKLIERYKQAILSKAFSGELTADWRNENPHDAADYMRMADVVATIDKDSPQLPQGWHWAQAGQVCSIKSGIALGKKRAPNTELLELPYLRVANVQRGWLNLNEIKTTHVTQREAELLYLQPGDVLMNEGGDRDKLGRGWVWEGKIENCIHQNHVFRLRPKDSNIPSRYISYYANEFGQRYFLDGGKQTTNLASISMSKVSALPLPVCTPDEMAIIVERIETAFGWLDKIAIEHARAAHLLPKLDQAILAKAFRGELVPQDPNDEPASALLDRIKAERSDQPQKRGRSRTA